MGDFIGVEHNNKKYFFLLNSTLLQQYHKYGDRSKPLISVETNLITNLVGGSPKNVLKCRTLHNI